MNKYNTIHSNLLRLCQIASDLTMQNQRRSLVSKRLRIETAKYQLLQL